MPYNPEQHGPKRIIGPGFHLQVFAVIKKVPAGRVTTYGDIGAALGLRSAARQVGFALAALNSNQEKAVPWHRVVNSKGELSPRGSGSVNPEQKRRLKKEGISVNPKGKIIDFRSVRYSFEIDNDDPAFAEIFGEEGLEE